MTLPFGKYKGQDICDTPTAYLKWFEENVDLSPNQRDAINAELKRRTSEESSVGSTESPTYTSFEEMLFQHICTWIVQENNAGRLRINHEDKEKMQKSLATTLKNEVPRLMNLWKAQKRNT